MDTATKTVQDTTTSVTHSVSKTFLSAKINQIKFSLNYILYSGTPNTGLILESPNYVRLYVNDALTYQEIFDPANALNNDYYINILNDYVVDIIPVKITLEVIFTAKAAGTGQTEDVDITLRMISTGQLQ